jgi:hypothetical protein
MFTFGWLTVTAEDISVWEQFPNAGITLVHTGPAETAAGEEFRLGAFDLSGPPLAGSDTGDGTALAGHHKIL